MTDQGTMTMEHKAPIAAKTAHNINTTYSRALGDFSAVCWDDAPSWQKDSSLAGVEAVIANPNTTPKQSHESWCNQKLEDGWAYGEVKDAEAKTHPCLVPYNELPAAQRQKDIILGAVVRGVLGIEETRSKVDEDFDFATVGYVRGVVRKILEEPKLEPLQGEDLEAIATLLKQSELLEEDRDRYESLSGRLRQVLNGVDVAKCIDLKLQYELESKARQAASVPMTICVVVAVDETLVELRKEGRIPILPEESLIEIYTPSGIVYAAIDRFSMELSGGPARLTCSLSPVGYARPHGAINIHETVGGLLDVGFSMSESHMRIVYGAAGRDVTDDS